MPLNDAIDTMQRREAALGPLWNAGRRIVIPVILVLVGMSFHQPVSTPSGCSSWSGSSSARSSDWNGI